MTTEELSAAFEKFDDEFLKAEERPRDLHAFILLNQLVPGKYDVLSCAAHDEVWLSYDPEEVAKVISEEQVRQLVRLGIRFDGESFQMFV